MKAAIYARFSTDKQSVASLEDQERLCRALADRHGWEVVGIYRDAAMRGARRDRRDYLALTADALAGKFQVVVAESLDRLNRDLEETARLYKRLKFVDVGIVTVSEGPISEIHVSITGLMGEMYTKNLGEKTRRGVEGRVLAGKSGGGRCFGYDVVGAIDASGNPITGERRINGAEAEVVREIYRRFAAGEGPRAIARALNGRGAPGPYGRRWGDTTIRGTRRGVPASSTTPPTSVDQLGGASATSRTQPQAAAWPALTRRAAPSSSRRLSCRLSMTSFGRP